jgi:hypothetical protein
MGGIIQLPTGWGAAEICADAAHISCAITPGPRAYDHLGNRLCWFPPANFGVQKLACDLEDCSRDVSFMAWQFGVAPAQYHERWVTTEVLAKLADMPMLEWLKTHGLFACAPGEPVRVELPGLRAELMVLAAGSRRMAFGFAS